MNHLILTFWLTASVAVSAQQKPLVKWTRTVKHQGNGQVDTINYTLDANEKRTFMVFACDSQHNATTVELVAPFMYYTDVIGEDSLTVVTIRTADGTILHRGYPVLRDSVTIAVITDREDVKRMLGGSVELSKYHGGFQTFHFPLADTTPLEAGQCK